LTKKFENKESYTHKYAKELLNQWLQKELTIQCYNQKYPIKNREQVISEYPITLCFPYLPKETTKKDSKWIYVADIAIKHKGIISEIFEVVNKNERIEEKLEFYASKKASVSYFINASHILGQIQKPETLQAIATTQYGEIILS